MIFFLLDLKNIKTMLSGVCFLIREAYRNEL